MFIINRQSDSCNLDLAPMCLWCHLSTRNETTLSQFQAGTHFGSNTLNKLTPRITANSTLGHNLFNANMSAYCDVLSHRDTFGRSISKVLA